MKKNQDKSFSINEGKAETDLLNNLFTFFIDKYGSDSISEVERHFVDAVKDLVKRKEVSQKIAKEFLEENGIEASLDTKPKYDTRNYDTYYDPCGRGSVSRSSC